VFCNTSGVTSASNSICRISRQDFSGSRSVFTSMAHKGVSENDASGHVQINVAGKVVEVVGVSGVSDTDIRCITVLVCFIIKVLPVLPFHTAAEM